MDRDAVAVLTATLVAENPRAQAANVLVTLAHLAEAAGAAVLVGRPDGDCELFAVTGEVPLALVVSAVQGARMGAGAALLPLSEQSPAFGSVYLHAPRQVLSVADQRLFCRTLEQAVLASRAPVPDANLQSHALGSVEHRERSRLLLAFEANNWNVMRAAKALGLNRRTVYVWMKRYSVERPGPATIGRPRKAQLTGSR